MKIIQKISVSLLMMALPLLANAQTSLSVSDFELQPGGEATFDVCMNNGSDKIWGVQFDMSMSSGITFKSAELVAARANGHDDPSHSVTGGKDRIIIQGDWDFNTFKGSEGAIVKITVKASSSFTSGQIDFSTIRFTKMEGDDPTSISGTDFTVNVTTGGSAPESIDGVKFYADQTSLELEASSGDVAQGVLSINLDNPNYYPNAVQFELTLPEGVTVASVSKTDRSSKLTVRSNVKDNGHVKVMLADMGKAVTITGNSGPICDITLEASDNTFQSGQVTIDGIQLINLDNLPFTTDAITIAVSNATGIEIATVSEQMKGSIYNLQGVKVATSQEGLSKGVYILNGKKFVIK